MGTSASSRINKAENTSKHNNEKKISKNHKKDSITLPKIRYQPIDSFYSNLLGENEILAIDQYKSCKEEYPEFWRFMEGSELKKSEIGIHNPLNEYVILKKFNLQSTTDQQSANTFEGKILE